jgi:uncharacterized hydrophobic protein (TIGR00271 family)
LGHAPTWLKAALTRSIPRLVIMHTDPHSSRSTRRTRLPIGHTIRGLEHRLHDRALHLLGLSPEDRVGTVESMFLKGRRDAANYWLLLLLSMGISTLGLVLGSTAVVIGAMLIAPLMGPIVELGMALTIGAPGLTVRSFIRFMGSVAAVVLGAALLTLVLPFHEMTPEIASRTLPTALDLMIAVFVALAAAFTSVRRTSETTSAAAGTAIGIALVPPLCVIGFGLGTMDPAVAGGATLLFLTNITAILFVSVLVFWVLGFETVDAARWDAEALGQAREGSPLHRSMRRVQLIYASKYGRLLRVGAPAMLIGVMLLPLSRALDQVAWEVRSRASVARILDQSLSSRSAVQSQLRVAQRQIAVDLYLVASADSAAQVQNELSNRIAAATSVVPTVRVVAVPDMSRLRAVRAAPEPERVPLAAHLVELRQRVGRAIHDLWPAERLGPLARWRLEVADSAGITIVIQYWGTASGPGFDDVLGRMLSQEVGTPLVVVSRPLSDSVVRAPIAEAARWLPELMRLVEARSAVEQAYVCVTIPSERAIRSMRAVAAVPDIVRGEAARAPADRLVVTEEGTEWSARLSRAPCTAGDDPATTGSAPVAAAASGGS